MKLLDGLINWISHLALDDESGHSEVFATPVLVGFLSVMAIMLLLI